MLHIKIVRPTNVHFNLGISKILIASVCLLMAMLTPLTLYADNAGSGIQSSSIEGELHLVKLSEKNVDDCSTFLSFRTEYSFQRVKKRVVMSTIEGRSVSTRKKRNRKRLSFRRKYRDIEKVDKLGVFVRVRNSRNGNKKVTVKHRVVFNGNKICSFVFKGKFKKS